MIDNYLNIPLSRYDLKLVFNVLINNKSVKKNKKLLCPTFDEIKQLLNFNGYKIFKHNYICPKSNKIKSYYILSIKY